MDFSENGRQSTLQLNPVYGEPDLRVIFDVGATMITLS